MHPDESKNEVLLNDNVRFLAYILTKDGKELTPNETVTHEDISDILGLYPSEKNDQNAAHIMLLRIKDKWYLAFNFVYNIALCKEKFLKSKEFFQTAKLSGDSKLWAPVIDNLYSSTELAIQASLLLVHRERFSVSQHPSTKVHLDAHSDAGNLDPKYKDHLANLHKLRLHERYQEGNLGKNFKLEDSGIRNFFTLTEELINYVDSLLCSAEHSRNPIVVAGGYLISIGKG